MPNYANIFTYPAGRRPGINRSHIGSKAPLLFSAVTLSTTGMYDMVTGRKPTAGPTAAFKMRGDIGPSFNYQSSGDFPSWGNSVITNYTNYTLACILCLDTASALQYFLTTSTGASGTAINISSTFIQLTMYGVLAITSAVALSSGIPYFICVSKVGTTESRFLARNLKNGVITTDTKGGSAGNAPNGFFCIGTDPASGSPTQGQIHCAMINGAATGLDEMKLWAARPWDFWYPPDYDVDDEFST